MTETRMNIFYIITFFARKKVCIYISSFSGLFRKVIGQSGSPLAHWSVTRYQEGPDYFFKVVSASLGCAGNDTRVVKKCLQNIPTDVFEQFMLNEFEVSFIEIHLKRWCIGSCRDICFNN